MKKTALIILSLLLAAFPSLAQESFEASFNEAVGYYLSRQYSNAITVLGAARKGADKEQTARADKLLRECKSPARRASGLILSRETLFPDGSGQSDSIAVTASRAWQVTASPDWATVTASPGMLVVTSLSNEDGTLRTGTVEISMGSERTAYVLVKQNPRAPTEGTVSIRTFPGRALVYIDSEPGMLSELFDLKEGRHTVRIEKDGFERKDSTIVLGREVETGSTGFNFRLTPTFATISVDISPEEGYSFDSAPTLDASGNGINLQPGDVRSFNVDQRICYYELYEGGLIPLHPGQYVLTAGAEGFLPQTRAISVSKGSENAFSFTLTPICGTLSVSDASNSEGAVVLLDGTPVGTVPLEGLRAKRGSHTLSLVKEGYITDEPEYTIEIPEDKEAFFKASMERFSAYTVSTEPTGCKVYLDGNYQGTSPVRMTLRQGEHTLRIEKTGFYPVEKAFRARLEVPESSDSIRLEEAWPLLITADKDSLGVIVSQGRGSARRVYATGKTPATLQIPISDNPYEVELTRTNLRQAWKGRVKFNDPSRSHRDILTWGTGSPVLSGDWYLAEPRTSFWDTPLMKNYKKVANFKFATLNILPGLSSSVLNTSVYWQTNASQSIHYPAVASADEGEGIPELVPGDAGYQNIVWIPSATVLFLNGEFRIGGALTHHTDANILASYAWYPSLRFLHSMGRRFCFTHMSGQDIFLGAEFNSRIPVFNAHVKAGIEAFLGQANICRPGSLPAETAEYRYYTQPYAVSSIADLQFVLSLGFTLGAGQSRGQNILRVF